MDTKQLKDIGGNDFYPKTNIESVDGLDDRLSKIESGEDDYNKIQDEKIKALEEKEDKDTIYDDSELRGLISDIQQNLITKEEIKKIIEEVLLEKNVVVYEDDYDPYNGYEYVNMGEAGIWATCNVGATKPEECGLYFAWGETEGYPDAVSGKSFQWTDYKYGTSATNLTKYNSTDSLSILDIDDDAVHVNMGGDWRMPTQTELQKLYDLCNNEWIDDYEGTGIKGVLFKLKTDENKQVFFPAGGSCSYRSLDYLNSRGSYWTSSLSSTNKSYGYLLYFTSTSVSPTTNNGRYYGRSVRGFIPSGTTGE